MKDLKSTLIARFNKINNTRLVTIDFNSIIINESSLNDLRSLSGGLSSLGKYFTINLASLPYYVSQNGIREHESILRNGKIFKKIYHAQSIIDYAINKGDFITVSESGAKDVFNIIYSNKEIISLNNEIDDKRARLNEINKAIELANAKLENISTKIKYKLGDDLLSEDEVFLMAGIKKRICGVYFLIKDDKIVYVGQSTNIHSRVETHESTKDFDRFTYVQCSKDDLSILEARYIAKFKPELNYDTNGRLVMPAKIPTY